MTQSLPISKTQDCDKYLFYCYLLVLLWVPIPLASNRPWSALLLTVVSSCLLFAWLVLYLQGKIRIPKVVFQARWAILSLVTFQAWVLIQSSVMPEAIVNLIAPTIFDHYSQVGFHENVYLSVDVHNTAKAFLLGIGLTLSFVLSLLLVNTQTRKSHLYSVIIISGVMQACYGVIIVFTDGGWLSYLALWFHENKLTASGTFVNSNHFAGYLNISLAIGIGVLLGNLTKQRVTTWRAYLRNIIATLLSASARLRIYLMILVVGLVMSHSRMGNSAFFIALTLAGLIFIFQKKKIDAKTIILLGSLVLVDSLLIGSWFGFDKIVESIENTDLSANTRTEINSSSKPLLLDHLLTGVGADGYRVIEPAYSVAPSYALTEHAHNDYFEFFINSGLIGVFFLSVFIIATLKALFNNWQVHKGSDFKNKKSQLDFGLVMLVIYTAVHSFADFNLFIPAFAYTLLACLGIAFVNNNLPNKTSH